MRETGGNVVRWWPAGPVRGHLFLFKVDMTRLIAAKLTGTRYTRVRARPVENDHNSPTAKRSTYKSTLKAGSSDESYHQLLPAYFATCKSLVLLAKKMNVG